MPFLDFADKNSLVQEKPSAPACFDADFDVWGWARRLPVRILFWPEGRGYTAEESAELHLPGAVPILDAVLARLIETQLVRLAHPGEFTLRAFLAGRLDLTEAEAVLGVIDAGDAESLSVALAQLAGNLATPLGEWRQTLLDTLADVEAGLDFADEGVEFLSAERLLDRIGAIRAALAELLERIVTRAEAGDSLRVLLTGPPNAGKSSLFNRMIDRFGRNFRGETGSPPPYPAAIVSSQAGTTRDRLEGKIEVDGLTVTLIDSAGVDENGSSPPKNSPDMSESHRRIEQTATRFALSARQHADLILWCTPSLPHISAEDGSPTVASSATDSGFFRKEGGPILHVRTKSDQISADETISANRRRPGRLGDGPAEGGIATSAKTGDGIERLAATIRRVLIGERRGGEVVPATATRCRTALIETDSALAAASELVRHSGDELLVADELRRALTELGRITGAVATDDLLDRVFSRFCLGK